MCNSYNSSHRYTRTIKYCISTIASSTYKSQLLTQHKASSFWGLRIPDPLSSGCALDPAGGTAPDPIICTPNTCYSPQTQSVWIKPCSNGGSKTIFLFFLMNIIQSQSNNVRYKVPFCENFHRQCVV